jgi:hypothetical protein
MKGGIRKSFHNMPILIQDRTQLFDQILTKRTSLYERTRKGEEYMFRKSVFRKRTLLHERTYTRKDYKGFFVQLYIICI